MRNNHFSQTVIIFHKRNLPEEGSLAGYAFLIQYHDLRAPLPDRLSLISQKHRRYDTEDWRVFTPRHAPEDSLGGHLTFALKYEGVELHVLKSLFQKISKNEIAQLVRNEPTGQYSRRVWFLCEWLTGEMIDVPDLTAGNFVDLLDPKLQYPGPSENSRRHRVRNNLPGTKDFCPLIRRTGKLDAFIASKQDWQMDKWLKEGQKDLLSRAAAFLLLKDSKASYAIEGEAPTQNRVLRWGVAIGEAGKRELTKVELLRLQEIVIGSERFIALGWRKQGGFVGEHDRATGVPIPDHISARWQDVENLIEGLLSTQQKLVNSEYDPVLASALIAFGFVVIHPFADGNGRIHRYLVQHVLTRMKYHPAGIIFPVSAAILQRMDEYRRVLEAYSHPRLELIEWRTTPDNNVEVLNDTIDLYRYFDATRQAEFLYDCVRQTALKILPAEVEYLEKYDRFKALIDNRFAMPDKTVALLVRFLEQGSGKLSAQARQKEFSMLGEVETVFVEDVYREVFGR